MTSFATLRFRENASCARTRPDFYARFTVSCRANDAIPARMFRRCQILADSCDPQSPSYIAMRSAMMRAIFTAACAVAVWSAYADAQGTSRRLMQQLPTLQAPAPAPGTSGPFCSCSIASIYSGVTYCFALTDTPGTNGTYSKQASPTCKAYNGLNCSSRIVTLASGTRTANYPNATLTGQGIQCEVTSFGNNPIPAPAAPPASPGAQPCIGLPAGDYGPTGTISYVNSPTTHSPTPDCTVPSDTVCSIYIPFGNGTAKICASNSAELQLRG